jgi:hypothetical protein
MVRSTLAGFGAMSIVGSVLTAIAFELWFDQVLVFPVGPPRFEPIGLVSYAAGAFVAARLGGWSALVGVLVLVAISFGHSLPFWFLRGLNGPDADFFVGPVWALAGVTLGGVPGIWRRGGVLWRTMLQAAGAYVVGRVAWIVVFDVVYGATWTGGERPGLMNWVDLSGALWSAGLGIVVGLLYGARLTRVELATVAASVAVTSAVIVAHQGAMSWGDGPTFFLSMASGVVGGIGILLGAAFARLRGGHASSLGFASP